MRAFASSFHAWKSLESQEGVKVPHGLTFPLAVVEAIGKEHGLTLEAEETTTRKASDFDAVFLGVLDSRCMIGAAAHFARWGVPFRRRNRDVGKWPLVWAGGQGLRNPLPLADVYDLCVIGDAEDPLPMLLKLWESHGNNRRFLELAASVHGVFVPSVHDRRLDTIVQSVSKDIGITLRNNVDVSHNGTRRVEIARGCKSKCAFCSLGWGQPMRENPPSAIVEALQDSRKPVHLQAGDAEAHSGITEIREAIAGLGGRDSGWTGRLDSLLENPDNAIRGDKRYAFGVEAMTHRTRRAIGKGYLTDERLVSGTLDVFARMPDGTRGRAAWHMIAGLPGERFGDTRDFMRVLQAIDDGMRASHARNLSIHWQPFQPLPFTPMQWAACGGGARKLADVVSSHKTQRYSVRHVSGRTDTMARMCTVLSRADERGADLLEAIAARDVSPDEAEAICGIGYGELDTDAPMPWEFVRGQYSMEQLRKAYRVVLSRI